MVLGSKSKVSKDNFECKAQKENNAAAKSGVGKFKQVDLFFELYSARKAAADCKAPSD